MYNLQVWFLERDLLAGGVFLHTSWNMLLKNDYFFIWKQFFKTHNRSLLPKVHSSTMIFPCPAKNLCHSLGCLWYLWDLYLS